MSRVRDVAARLESRHTKTPDGCWVWTGYNDGRYGLISIKGKEEKAHRASYRQYVGEIPDGYSVMHACDNTLCMNPEHLSVGTHADNMKDMVDKGRSRSGRAKYEERKGFIGMTISEIMQYGYSQSHASRLRRGIYA